MHEVLTVLAVVPYAPTRSVMVRPNSRNRFRVLDLLPC